MPATKIHVPSVEEIEKAIEIPSDEWARQCHLISIRIVQSDVLGVFSRVARGSCRGVLGQHSWVVLDHNAYHEKATIIDCTLWSYDDRVINRVWVGTPKTRPHVPKGSGNIWHYGRPETGDGPPVDLTPTVPLSSDARVFLDLVGPLDLKGWMSLANGPMGGWPAAEIIAAMNDTEALRAVVPIDILGMITDRNPGNLYLKADES